MLGSPIRFFSCLSSRLQWCFDLSTYIVEFLPLWWPILWNFIIICHSHWHHAQPNTNESFLGLLSIFFFFFCLRVFNFAITLFFPYFRVAIFIPQGYLISTLLYFISEGHLLFPIFQVSGGSASINNQLIYFILFSSMSSIIMGNMYRCIPLLFLLRFTSTIWRLFSTLS